MSDAEVKTCNKCGKTKPLTEFSKRSDNGLYRGRAKSAEKSKHTKSG